MGYLLALCTYMNRTSVFKACPIFGNGHRSEKTQDLDIETPEVRPDAAAH